MMTIQQYVLDLEKALMVITKTPSIRRHLSKNDPQALRQCDEALGNTQHYRAVFIRKGASLHHEFTISGTSFLDAAANAESMMPSEWATYCAENQFQKREDDVLELISLEIQS